MQKTDSDVIINIGKKLEKKKDIIIYGCTNEMMDIYSRTSLLINQVFVCDSEKRGMPLGNGFIYSLEEIFPLLHQGTYILIISTDHTDVSAIKKKLMLEGFIENEDYFMSDVFKKQYLPIWALYAHGKCYVDFIGHPINLKCTLRCKACSACIPYLNIESPSVEQIKSEIDLFFSKVDVCHTYDLTSGETFAVSDKVVEVAEYLIDNYKGRFSKILMVTNATVIPTPKMLEFLKAHQNIIKIDISIYSTIPGWKEKFEHFKEIMNEWNIPYSQSPVTHWIDFGFKNTNHNMNNEELCKWFDLCNNFCRLYMNGKIYYCASGHLANLAFYKDANDDDEALDLRNSNISALNIIEYNLGYFEKGCLNICNHCNGWGEKNKKNIPIAEQL